MHGFGAIEYRGDVLECLKIVDFGRKDGRQKKCKLRKNKLPRPYVICSFSSAFFDVVADFGSLFFIHHWKNLLHMHTQPPNKPCGTQHTYQKI